MINRKLEIAANLAELRENLNVALQQAGRKAEELKLLAVTKTWPLNDLEIAHELGLREFGENKVQELLTKVAAFEVKQIPISWHLIGSLQRNKVKAVYGRCCLIHSVDRMELLDCLLEQGRKSGERAAILLQVNPAAEASKHGFAHEGLKEAVETCLAHTALLDLQGLMCMAPAFEDAERARPVFERCRSWRDELAAAYGAQHFQTLSMGMSHDYREAILEGSTVVRVGSAIFGPRSYVK